MTTIFFYSFDYQYFIIYFNRLFLIVDAFDDAILGNIFFQRIPLFTCAEIVDNRGASGMSIYSYAPDICRNRYFFDHGDVY